MAIPNDNQTSEGTRHMQHISRRAAALVGVVGLLLTTVAAPSAAAPDEPSVAVPVVRLEGRGHGHGVGMSQWGAYTMASRGASAADIIGTFYPGTQLAQLGGEVVVVVDQRDRTRLRFPGGGEVRSARDGGQHPGFPVSVPPGGSVEVVRTAAGYQVTGDGVAPLSARAPVRYSSPTQRECFLVLCPPAGPDPEPAPATTEPAPQEPGTDPAPAEPAPAPGPSPSPGATPTPPPGEPPPPEPTGPPVSPTPVWAVPAGGSGITAADRGRTYRGVLEVTGAPGAVKVRNHVDIEDYLKGMAEVPSSWPPGAVQAQAIAARTYALRAMAASGELCDSESCQVYVGTTRETAGQSAAVEATRGTVVTFGGALAATFYSASGGGFAANVAEGFGSAGDVPYLPAHPYETVHPDEWAVDIALSDVARRLGYPGTVRSVTVDETGPSGRPLRMTLHGDAGPRGVDPQDFRRRLGLRSTLFTVRTAETETAPPPPPEAPDPGVVGDRGAEPEVFRHFASPDVDALAAADEVVLGARGAGSRSAAVVALAAVLVVLTWMAAILRGPAMMGPWRKRSR